MSGLRIVRGSELQPHTAQTPGMTRYAGVAASTVGSKHIWLGYVTMGPGAHSGAHHHGDCESAIYIIRGRARFRFGDRLEETIEAGPGDFIYVPPKVVHQEMNASDSEELDAIVARDSQENIVANIDLPEAVLQEE